MTPCCLSPFSNHATPPTTLTQPCKTPSSLRPHSYTHSTSPEPPSNPLPPFDPSPHPSLLTSQFWMQNGQSSSEALPLCPCAHNSRSSGPGIVYNSFSVASLLGHFYGKGSSPYSDNPFSCLQHTPCSWTRQASFLHSLDLYNCFQLLAQHQTS